MNQTRIEVPFGELLAAAGADFDPQLVEFFEEEEKLAYQVRKPSSDEGPPGLLIYISPKPGAQMPAAWGEVLNERNLAWVGAEESGNEVHVARRVGMALLAPYALILAGEGEFDMESKILSGFSGGGRVASMMMPVYPDRYSGALFICGVNALYVASHEAINGLLQLPMLFLTGTGDFNLDDTRMAIMTYEQAGLQNVRLTVVDELGHALPEAGDLALALDFLAR
jgi:pimeloyl-ACP methyl ester carboxylesterase